MGGVTIRIDPVMISIGATALPMPYVLLLRDLARLNAGRVLPKIPQSFVEAQVRLAAERLRALEQHRIRLGSREALPPAGPEAYTRLFVPGQQDQPHQRAEEHRAGHRLVGVAAHLGIGLPLGLSRWIQRLPRRLAPTAPRSGSPQ